MSLTKRGKTWHTHFFLDGQRFRQSLETSDWREAQSKEKDLIAQAKGGKLSPTKQGFARLPFKDAAKQFLEDRTPQLAPLSIRTERERAKAINEKLGDVQISRLTPDLILAHIRGRKADDIANATINRELDIIRGVLKKAKRWHLFADEIKPLPLRQKIGRALSYEEKLKLLKTAAGRDEWQNAAWAATLALNTTMRGCEIKQLRWRDIDLMEKTVVIGKSKTEAGERVIPLNNDAWNTVLLLYARAKKLGEVRPDYYVFPACEAGHVDPKQAQKSWRTAWRNLTRLIACPACGTQQAPAKKCSNEKCGKDIEKTKSPLAGLRFHDLRHHAITELAESQASDSTVMAIAGHVSSKMLAHYSHVRLQAKRTALDSLSTKQAARTNSGSGMKGCDTNNDTKQHAAEAVPPQVLANMVELVGIEPTTSSLRTMRSPS
jgi:integrase